jgi:hypothetical protein
VSDVKMIRLGDMLTDEQVQRCAALYPNRERIRDEVVKPNMAEIDRKLGQENDPDYLSYAIVYVLGEYEKLCRN